MESINKIFFTPGDVVTIKHPISNAPTMLVKGKETKTIRSTDATHFVGIKCFWFTKDGLYQEQVFSTKDLSHHRETEAVSPDIVYVRTGYSGPAFTYTTSDETK